MNRQAASLAVVAPQSSLKNDIDRLGTLQAILADYALQIEPYKLEADRLEAQILERFEKEPAKQIFVDEGNGYRLKIGMRSEQQQLSLDGKFKIWKWIGRDTYLSLSKISFEALKSALTAEQYQIVVSKERTGNRSVKVVVKAAPEPLRAA